jgi:hypothetical protein
LAILRTLKLVVHAARLCYPGDSNVREMDDQIQYKANALVPVIVRLT